MNNKIDINQSAYEEMIEVDPNNEQPDPNLEEEKKKRIKIILISVAAVVGILLVIYFIGVFYFTSHFLPNTQINAIDVGGDNTEKALETVGDSYLERSVEIVAEDGTDTVTGAEIDLVFDENDISDIEELLNQQNAFSWPAHLFSSHEVDLNSDYSVNEDKLTETIDSLSIVSGSQVVAPKNAEIYYNGTDYAIEPEVEGDQPNVDELKEAVVKALVVGDKTINLTEEDLYNRPTILSDNEDLQKELSEFNKAIEASITLNFPNQKIVLDKNTFQPWLVVSNGAVTVDDNLNNYVAQLASEFDSNGKDINFTATNGTVYIFKDDSGWVLNQSSEIDQLRSQILDGTVITEDPIWSQKGHNAITGNSVSGNYIEIDLASQHLWYYQDNALNTSTSIVSGDVQRNQATATGLYFLESKDTNVSLSVYYPDGSLNNVQVKYWMPFTSYYGIESASFRADFGGEIYKTQGTDGDIDIPEQAAQSLYDYVSVGTPVFIY